MLRLTRRVLQTIEAVLDVAYYGGGTPVKSHQIMERNNIPARYLESTLQVLVRRGILTSIRGPDGGFRLAKERRRLTLYQLYEIVRELEAEDDPIDQFARDAGSELGLKVLVPTWAGFQEAVLEQMKTITVEDLCKMAKDAEVTGGIRELTEVT